MVKAGGVVFSDFSSSAWITSGAGLADWTVEIVSNQVKVSILITLISQLFMYRIMPK